MLIPRQFILRGLFVEVDSATYVTLDRLHEYVVVRKRDTAQCA